MRFTFLLWIQMSIGLNILNYLAANNNKLEKGDANYTKVHSSLFLTFTAIKYLLHVQ